MNSNSPSQRSESLADIDSPQRLFQDRTNTGAIFEDKDYKRMLSKLENDLRQDILRHKTLKADSD